MLIKVTHRKEQSFQPVICSHTRTNPANTVSKQLKPFINSILIQKRVLDNKTGKRLWKIQTDSSVGFAKWNSLYVYGTLPEKTAYLF